MPEESPRTLPSPLITPFTVSSPTSCPGSPAGRTAPDCRMSLPRTAGSRTDRGDRSGRRCTPRPAASPPARGLRRCGCRRRLSGGSRRRRGGRRRRRRLLVERFGVLLMRLRRLARRLLSQPRWQPAGAVPALPVPAATALLAPPRDVRRRTSTRAAMKTMRIIEPRRNAAPSLGRFLQHERRRGAFGGDRRIRVAAARSRESRCR